MLFAFYNTVDREIFTLKIIPVKVFLGVKFRGSFHLRNILMVDGYNMDERLECS